MLVNVAFLPGFTMLIWSKRLNRAAGQVLAYCYTIARLLRSLVLTRPSEFQLVI